MAQPEIEHSVAPLGERHAPYNWLFADTAARMTAGSYVAEDIGKWAYQADSSTIWQLVTTAPTWVQVAPSTAGNDANYEHSQVLAATTWVIVHNLGKRPSVSVMDTSGDEVHGDVSYDTVNQVTLSFSAPFSGTAILN